MWYQWVDEVLRQKEHFIMPPKLHLGQDEGDYFNVMPTIFTKSNVAMVKMIGRHSIKHGEHRSVMMGDLLLYEADTGILKSLMDAEYITTLRTGSVAAHSAVLFARKNFQVMGLIGLGNIMKVFFRTFIAAAKALSILPKKLTVKLYKHHDQEIQFAKEFSDIPFLKFIYCDTYEDTISDSDIVISAVTKASKNFAPDRCFKKGVTVIPICTMGFQNCDLFFDKVFSDEIAQIRGFKYFNSFKSVAEVSDVLNGKVKGRNDESERILVYNYGIAAQDLYFALKLYPFCSENQISYHYPTSKYFI